MMKGEFFMACQKGDTTKVASLLAATRMDVNQALNNGATPFIIACYKGHQEVVALLLADVRVEVNQAQNEGATPFFIACQEGQQEVVALLLADARVEVNQAQNDGITPFFIACQEGHQEVVALLLANARVDVNKADNFGRTPFFMACREGQQEVVALLLADARVVVNQAMNDNATPFFIACEKGHQEVVALLLADARVEVNQAQNEGATPFFMACQEGHQEIVALLLADTRVEVNQAENESATPFFIACEKGHQEVVALLLADARVDVNQAQNDGTTPFSIACQEGQQEVVALLLADARVDVNQALNVLCRRLQRKEIVPDLVREMLTILFTAGFKRNPQLLLEKNSGTVFLALTHLLPHEVVISTNQLQLAGLAYNFYPLQEGSRKEVQQELAASLYALAIFYTDDSLQSWSVEGNTRRFFDILKKLPLELHMLICNRYTGLSADIIARALSEQAFRTWVVIFNQDELSSVFKIAVFKKIYAALGLVLSSLGHSVVSLPEGELTRSTLYQAAPKNPLITRAWLLTQTYYPSRLSKNKPLINKIIPEDLSERAELMKAVVKKLS